ncbi:MAG: hypothetical protein KDA53_03760 [Hyphomonas sp.]|nr:hypothetical protein [Hyphomonas sp.]
MTPESYISVAMETGHRLDTQWGLYISVHLALFGAVLYVRRPLGMAEKVIGIGLYTVFGVYSLRVMLSLRDLLERTAHQVDAMLEKDASANDLVLGYFSNLSNSGHFANGTISITSVHFIGLAMVASALLSGTSWRLLRRKLKP